MATDDRIAHRPTLVYTPWTNGTVQRINRGILSAMRALLSDLKLASKDWPSIVDLLPAILNEAPLMRHGKI